MKIYRFLLLVFFSCIFIPAAFAGNPRIVAVRIAGDVLPQPSSSDFNWKAWLSKDATEVLANGDEFNFISYAGTKPSAYAWEYVLIINLAKFQAWTKDDVLNIEVELNGKTATAWAETIGTNANVSQNYMEDALKFIVFEGVKPKIKVTGTSVCKGVAGEVTATITDAPDDLLTAGYVIDWGDADISTKAGSLSKTAATGTVGTGFAATKTNLKASLKKADGTVVCTSDEYTVTVNAIPVVSFENTPYEVCKGSTIKIKAKSDIGADSYSWSTSAGPAGNVQEISVIPTSDTDYKAEVTKNGCKGEETVRVTVNELPTVILAVNKADVCAGTSVTLTPTPSGGSGTGWNYTYSDGASSASVIVTAGEHNYSVTVKDSKGCVSAPGKVKVVGHEVKVNPADKTICNGETAKLDANASFNPDALKGEVEYEWIGSNMASGDKTASMTTSALEADETYQLTVTDGFGCTATKNVTVTVNKCTDPKIVVTGIEFCEGVTGQKVTAQISGMGADFPTGYSVDWASSNVTTAGAVGNTTTGNIKDGLKPADSFTVTATLKKGTTVVATSDAYTVTINPLPVLTSLSVDGNKTDVCKGETINLTAVGSGGTNPHYVWTGGPTGTAANSSVAVAVGEQTYSVQMKDDKNCLSKDTKEVKVTGHQVEVNASNVQVCSGEAADLKATVNFTPAVTDETGVIYKWQGTNIVSGDNAKDAKTDILTAIGTTQYTFTATDKFGCDASKQINVEVKNCSGPLELTINTPNPNGCKNDNIALSVSATGGSGEATYTWTPDAGVTITGTGANVTAQANAAGIYNVHVKVVKGTETKEGDMTLTVTDCDATVTLRMTVDEKCAYDGEFLTITITGSGADTYSFILRDQSNNPVMPVNDQASWGVYKVYAGAAGTYKITDFKYKIGGVESNGTVPDPVKAMFNPIPNVYAMADHSTTLSHCQGDMLTLKGSGDPNVKYDWNNGVTDGVPFNPTIAGKYEVTATDLTTQCKNTSSVNVTINPKPTVVVPQPQEVCAGDLVTLTATGTGADQFDWNNGVVNGQPFRATLSAEYEVTAINSTTGCSVKATTTVTANQPPHIVRKSKNPRNIAIGKDVYFAVTAEGKNLTYQWLKKENGAWVNLSDNTNATPVVLGSKTDSLSMLSVPQSWDGSEFKVIVSGDCGKDSTEFQLGVKECFAISAELVMYEGIIPDEEPGNKIDGWYCRGQKIALKAIITSEEGYDIENAHYKWSIDGLDIPQEHVEMESDTAILTWIPQFTEDDIVIKVCAYCDGACEEICPKYIRLKAREFEDVAMRILTDKDPDHKFCAGDTVNFWIASKNAGEKPVYTWYNDVFELPEQESPRNKVIRYENEKVTMLMGQEDTWMRVIMQPSPEVCIKEPVVVDTVFMKKKPWVEPSLHIDCSDTLVCKGDSVSMQAIYANAGEQPTFQWQRSIGDPFPDWNLGTKEYAVVHIDEEDVWVKCTMVPSNDVCYDQTKPLVDAIQINVLKANAEVTIACDMEDKQAGDELVFESEVKNILGEPQYEWYIDGRKDPITDSELVTDALKQGNVVYCMVSGERVCQTRVKSNEIVVDYGQFNRDTMITIYKNEWVKNLDMLKEGDQPGVVLFQIEIAANYGVSTITPNGKFDYTPNAGFVGTDVVKYVILNRKDKTVLAEGYIYITVQENDRFFVPNLITPNEDGLNDTWQLDFISAYPDHLIQVFDRNGNIVYEARNYQNDWKGEGMTKGGYVGHINLVNGVYTYVIDLGDKDKTILKSWIEIRSNLNRRNYR